MVLQLHYLKRNPNFAFSQVVEDIPDHEAASRVYPLSANITTAAFHTGYFTSACGVTISARSRWREEASARRIARGQEAHPRGSTRPRRAAGRRPRRVTRRSTSATARAEAISPRGRCGGCVYRGS